MYVQTPAMPPGPSLSKPIGRLRGPRLGGAAWAFLALVVGACGEAPVLQVGDVSFVTGDLAGLGEERIEQLILVTAVGLASHHGEEARALAPVIRARQDQELIRMLRREVVLEAHEIGHEVLRARYRVNPELELVVRHLLMRAERGEARETRDEARRRAEAALARARAGEPFAELAAEVSEEPGAAQRGGLLEPGREGSWVREFWEAALALEEGQVSPVVETRYGYHVLFLEERREVPFEEARDRVADEVARMVDDGEDWEAALERWTQGLQVHGEAVAAFDPEAPDPESVLAAWPRGELRAPGMTVWLRGLARSRFRDFVGGGAAIREGEVRRAARDRTLVAEAEERGLRIPEEGAEEIRREWTDRVARWAAALELTDVAGADDLREAALFALGATGQEARIARREMEERAPALRAAWPVERR